MRNQNILNLLHYSPWRKNIHNYKKHCHKEGFFKQSPEIVHKKIKKIPSVGRTKDLIKGTVAGHPRYNFLY